MQRECGLYGTLGRHAAHFTTIATFISSMGEVIVPVFRDVVSVCYAEGLIGGQMFAIDGCKISSDCAKQWSGTKKELLKKAEKIERSIAIRAPPSAWIASPSEAVARWMLSGSSTERVHNIGKLARYGPSFSTALA